MKIKILITVVLSSLLLMFAVSCDRDDSVKNPSATDSQDSGTVTQDESVPPTDAPDDVTDETPTEDNDETETSEVTICDHVFEDGLCTLCGSDTTALFLFSKQESLASGVSYEIYGTQGTLPAVLTIPDTYNGAPVKWIRSGAIKDSDTLTDLTIPDSIYVSNSAIGGCPNLKTLRLSLNSLVANSYLDRNFGWLLDEESKKNLTTLYLSSGTTKLFEGIFGSCDYLETVYLPAELKEVEAFAFNGCISLKNIIIDENNPFFYVENNCLINKANKKIVAAGAGAVIPNDGSITAIGRGAFSGLDLYKELVIPDCIKEIGGSAFSGWDNLEKLTIPFLGYAINENDDGHLGTIFGAHYHDQNETTVPPSLKEVTVTGGKVLHYAFWNCKNLVTINLEGVTSIDKFAFNGCKKLKTLHLGKKAQTLANLPTGVTITLDEENPYFSLREDGTFYNKEGTKIILANKNTVLPTDGTLLEIGESAFAGCYTQQTLVIPDSVVRIEKNAFANNTNLCELTLPAALTSIGEGAFSECTKLTRVYGGAGIEWIGASAFSGCTGLLTVEPMPSLKGVSAKAFLSCRNLQAVPWDETATQLKTIAESAFEGCAKITTVVMPEAVSILGNSAFSGCTSLETVEFSSKIKTIPVSCFDGCNTLHNVIFKEGLQTIEYGAFFDCKKLNEVIFPNSLVTLGQVTFSSIQKLHIGSGLAEVCHNSLPKTIETVTLSEDNPHFYLSSGSLVDAMTETLVWGNGQNILAFDRPFKAVGEYAFYGCTNLYVITLPEGCEAIGDSAFSYCTKLVEVNLPTTLKSMYDDSFNKCPAYEDMEIPKGVEILK
ncbi:MAG: leucine-rich repeat protein [Clostridia bacterium]|nr:leucine-rich repeat protein [Clostridia bacterium]